MNRKFWLLLLILNGLMLFTNSPKAQAYIGLCCAHCGGNMPMNIPGGGIPETHEFRIKIGQSFMRMGPLQDGTDRINDGDLLGMPSAGRSAAIPTSMDMYMTMASVAYSFTDNFAAMIMSSYKRNEMPMKFNSGLTSSTGTSGFTMDSDGIGDTKLLGKYRIFADDDLAPRRQFSALFGMSLPTGSTDETFDNHPVAAQNGTILPFKMQLGSGTVDPIIGVTYQGSKDPWWYGLNAIYVGRFYDNEEGYNQGDQVFIDAYGMYQFHPRALVQAQLNGSYEGQYSDEPDVGRIDGEGHANFNPTSTFLSPLFDPDNYGGTKLSTSFGFQVQPFPLHIIDLTATIPLYQNLNGPQLRDDWKIMFTYYIEIPTKKSRRYTGTKAPKELGF